MTLKPDSSTVAPNSYNKSSIAFPVFSLAVSKMLPPLSIKLMNCLALTSFS